MMILSVTNEQPAIYYLNTGEMKGANDTLGGSWVGVGMAKKLNALHVSFHL